MADPIGSYGLLGDTRTGALVSEAGSIDWLCIPRFDGEPVFGSLVDPTHGGSWTLRVHDGRVVSRTYNEHAASIQTRWDAPAGVATVDEGLLADVSTRLMPRLALVRHLRCETGEVSLETVWDPRLGLPGRRPERVRRCGEATICSWGTVVVALSADHGSPIPPEERHVFRLRAGQDATMIFAAGVREPVVLVDPSRGERLLARDDEWWRSWIEGFTYQGPHAGNIARSLITLRLLTYAPSGAPVAAPTTSLPAPQGSGRTWDYRFSWPRDASIGVGGMLALGGLTEPSAFLEWFTNASRITRPRLEVLYNLDGRPVRYEREVSGVAGYGRGRPVRIGNAASAQHQLDVYGWVIDAGWLMHHGGHVLSRPQWRALRSFADHIARVWTQPDHGIWEERGPRQHYVHSLLMAWTGLDRALRLAQCYPAPRADTWRRECDRIATQIHSRGIDPAHKRYRRILDRDELDASLLIVPVLQFDDDAERVTSTIDAIRTELGAGGPLVYRFLLDGDAFEGAFVPCSFWLVQALARTGRLEEAEDAFSQLCAMSTSLGLYGEQIDPTTREPLGNFPLAFSHAAFLQAAAALNEARAATPRSVRTSHVRSA